MKTVWEDVIIDFVTVLPPSKSLIVIMDVVDHLSKSAHFGPLPTDFSVAKMIITQKRAFSSILFSLNQTLFVMETHTLLILHVVSPETRY